MFFGPQYFLGALPEFLDMRYKIEPDSDDVAKFRGDRPRDLGVWALNKKTSRLKHKPVRNGGSGRPKKKEKNRRPPVTTYGRPNKNVGEIINVYYNNEEKDNERGKNCYLPNGKPGLS